MSDDSNDRPETSTREVFTVAGMTCGHCVQAVTNELRRLDGVLAVEVDLASGTAAVESTAPLAHDDVAAAIDEAGYELVP